VPWTLCLSRIWSIAFMRVDLPEPLGPMMPCMPGESRVKLMFRIAVFAP